MIPDDEIKRHLVHLFEQQLAAVDLEKVRDGEVYEIGLSPPRARVDVVTRFYPERADHDSMSRTRERLLATIVELRARAVSLSKLAADALHSHGMDPGPAGNYQREPEEGE